MKKLLIFLAIVAYSENLDLLKTIEDTTKIATKKKLNIDFAPGIINVLKQEDLRRLGVRDLYEALELIPGIDLNIDSDGAKSLIIRGIGGKLGSGKTKILINGVSQNTSSTSFMYSSIPIELIERIEVIRGPASALYGEYAFNGVINIITKKSNSIFSRYTKLDKNDIKTAGFTASNNNFSILYSYDTTKGLEPLVVDKNDNNKLKEVETLNNDNILISTLNYKDYILKFISTQNKRGAFYGVDGKVPPNDDNYNYISKNYNIELSKKISLSNDFYMVPKIKYFVYELDLTFDAFYNNFLYRDNISQVTSYSKYRDIVIGSEFFKDIKNHSLLLGLEYTNTKKIGFDTDINYINYVVIPQTSKDERREISSLYFQDNFIKGKFAINIGFRYDKYNDKYNKVLNDAFLPRLSTIYKLNHFNILKFQYGKAFRPPTFLEEWQSSLDFEKISMYEFEYIYKDYNQKFSTTFFYSKIRDLIEEDNLPAYANKSNIDSKGIELEYKKNLDEILFLSNISYVTLDDDNEDLKDYSKILSNITISYKPYSIFSQNLLFHYISEKVNNYNRINNKLFIDLTFRYVKLNKYNFSFGIKNIFDTKIYSLYNGSNLDDNILIKRREIFLGLEYKF